MRKLVYHVLVLSAFTLLYTCSSNSNTSESLEPSASDELVTTLENPFDNTIFYRTADGNEIRITTELLTKEWRKSFNLEGYDFTNFKIVEDKDLSAKSSKKAYYIKARTSDGSVSVSQSISRDANGKFFLTGKTCKCETNSCSWSGCDASQSGSTCRCSPCNGDCKKTSETTEDDAGI